MTFPEIRLRIEAKDVVVRVVPFAPTPYAIVRFGPIEWIPIGYGDACAEELLAVARTLVDAAVACCEHPAEELRALDSGLRLVGHGPRKQ